VEDWISYDALRATAHGVCLLLLSVATTSPAADRYVALFEDGARVSAAELKDWNDPQAQPRIADRALFDAAKPMRWVIDRQQWTDETPRQFVEIIGGDCLPGEVIGYGTGRESPFEQLPPHLLVRPASELQPPDDPELGVVRVQLDGVRRVAWNHRPSQPYHPGTAFLQNGGEIAFRSLRWTTGNVVLLVEDGIRELAFADLDELHLPTGSPWDAYAAELTMTNWGLSARMLQWDTLDGGRFTTSATRYQARHWGDKNRPEAWHHLVQPYWSLDPLWIRFRTVHTWRSWAPLEPPLGRFGPQSIRREAVFSQGWQWQADRNTQGRRLQIGTTEFAAGFGVHATTDLVFEWPALAKELRVAGGLDQAAGPRGCVNLSILDGESRILFQRDRLVGSRESVETNWLPIPGNTRALTLRADMAAHNRPSDADPFDIRDVVAWGDPQVRLDRAALPTAAKDSLNSLPGLAGWSMNDEDLASLHTQTVCDATEARDPRFRTVFRTVDPFVVLSRPLRIGSDDRWLSLVVSRFSDHAPSSVQLKIDGVSCGEFDVPVRQGPIDPDPVLVPVGDYRGKTVQLDVVVYPSSEKAWIDWRGVALTPLPPGVRVLWEDAAATPGGALDQALNGALVDANPSFTGRNSLRLAPGQAVEFSELPNGEAFIAEAPKLGQYRYVTFAWRGENTSGLSLQLAHEGRFGTHIADALIGRPAVRKPSRGVRSRKLDDRGLRYGYAYDSGSYQPQSGSPLRLDRNVPAQWKLESRDLYADFGTMAITGFALQCHERGAGWFDHIYLARSPQDLDFAKTYLLPSPPPAADATYSRKATRPEEWGPAIASFAPAFAAREASHGVLQKREHLGQSDGWQTHPQDKDKPFVLRTGLHLPADRIQELDLRVSHQPQCDWRLVVRVNGERYFEKLINDDLTRPQRGWASLQVDLSKYRGQKVLLEVLNESNDWNSEHAIWKRVVLQDLD